jgi:LysM repeat protein
MSVRLRGALLTLASFGAAVVPLLAACSDNGSSTPSTAVSFSTIEVTTSIAAGDATTTSVPADIPYIVQRGDALTKIADDFCTKASDIATLNAWSAGIDHVILPGQTIKIPGPGCPVASSSTTSTTIVMNKYLALYVDQHVITNPFNPDTGDHKNWGTVCYTAYWAAQAFATQGASKADLLAALDPLPGSVPGGVVAQIDRWVPFSNQWFPVYTEITSRIQATHPMYPDTDTYYRILFDDAEYLSLLQAYESVGSDVQFAAKYYVSDLCTGLFTTHNSTP